MSLRTQGLGLCPLQDPVLGQHMSQIHSAARYTKLSIWGKRGSRWQCLEKDRVGIGCECVCILGEEHPSPRVGTPHRGQSPGESHWILDSNPLVVQMGKMTPKKEGMGPGSSSWLVTEPKFRLGEQGHMVFSASSAHLKLLHLCGKEE